MIMPHRVIGRLLVCALFSVSAFNVFTWGSSASTANPSDDVVCPSSELADDVLVVLRTGATESQEKLPVHFRTTLKCVPHYVVFSDMKEEVDGVEVHDVLGEVTEATKKDNDDFKLYRHLQQRGCHKSLRIVEGRLPANRQSRLET
jgi:hypothetical protein